MPLMTYLGSLRGLKPEDRRVYCISSVRPIPTALCPFSADLRLPKGPSPPESATRTHHLRTRTNKSSAFHRFPLSGPLIWHPCDFFWSRPYPLCLSPPLPLAQENFWSFPPRRATRVPQPWLPKKYTSRCLPVSLPLPLFFESHWLIRHSTLS